MQQSGGRLQEGSRAARRWVQGQRGEGMRPKAVEQLQALGAAGFSSERPGAEGVWSGWGRGWFLCGQASPGAVLNRLKTGRRETRWKLSLGLGQEAGPAPRPQQGERGQSLAILKAEPMGFTEIGRRETLKMMPRLPEPTAG